MSVAPTVWVSVRWPEIGIESIIGTRCTMTAQRLPRGGSCRIASRHTRGLVIPDPIINIMSIRGLEGTRLGLCRPEHRRH